MGEARLLGPLLWRCINFLAPLRSDLRRILQLTFVDFLEALAWLAGLVPMPSDEDMKMANVRGQR